MCGFLINNIKLGYLGIDDKLDIFPVRHLRCWDQSWGLRLKATLHFTEFFPPSLALLRSIPVRFFFQGETVVLSIYHDKICPHPPSPPKVSSYLLLLLLVHGMEIDNVKQTEQKYGSSCATRCREYKNILEISWRF